MPGTRSATHGQKSRSMSASMNRKSAANASSSKGSKQSASSLSKKATPQSRRKSRSASKVSNSAPSVEPMDIMSDHVEPTDAVPSDAEPTRNQVDNSASKHSPKKSKSNASPASARSVRKSARSALSSGMNMMKTFAQENPNATGLLAAAAGAAAGTTVTTLAKKAYRASQGQKEKRKEHVRRSAEARFNRENAGIFGKIFTLFPEDFPYQPNMYYAGQSEEIIVMENIVHDLEQLEKRLQKLASEEDKEQARAEFNKLHSYHQIPKSVKVKDFIADKKVDLEQLRTAINAEIEKMLKKKRDEAAKAKSGATSGSDKPLDTVKNTVGKAVSEMKQKAGDITRHASANVGALQEGAAAALGNAMKKRRSRTKPSPKETSQGFSPTSTVSLPGGHNGESSTDTDDGQTWTDAEASDEDNAQ